MRNALASGAAKALAILSFAFLSALTLGMLP